MPKTRKTPQQKKRESYLKDRVNVYGENSKGSRKAIPRRKRISAHKVRRKMSVLDGATGRRDRDVERAVGERASERADRGWWEKTPDRPLGEVLGRKFTRRAKLGIISKKTAKEKSRKLPRAAHPR